jgi:hypothetical protein
MDPDHWYNPIEGESILHGVFAFDPNDTYEATMSPVISPDDNRVISAGVGDLAIGGTLSDTVLTYMPDDQIKTTTLSIESPQPGNNFIGLAYPKRHAEAWNDADKVEFDSDGVTLRTLTGGFVPTENKTKILDVWRTLWVELDSMNNPAGGSFGATDPNPGDLGNVSIDLLPPNFWPAQIEVRKVVEGATLPADDIKDDRFFYHYLEDVPAEPMMHYGRGAANDVRDVPARADLWVIHLIHGYEDARSNDFDDEYVNNLGLSIPGTSSAFVFAETIRQRAAWVSDPNDENDPENSVDADRLQKRAALHEAGHLMGAVHGEGKQHGIMDPEGAKLESWTDNEATFQIQHFGTFQWKISPSFP